MADMKWIKLATDIPDNMKIKRIRRLPDGNNVILFWVFLLARAGDSNSKGGLFISDRLPYTVEDLADDFNFSTEFVNFALITLEQNRMIEIYEDIIFIKNWEEYQSVDKFEKIREQTRIRVANHREKQKQLALENKCNVTCNADVTQSNATDIELELDKELDKEKDILSSSDEQDDVPYKEIIDYLNLKTSKSYKHSTSKTKSLIKARWNEGFRVDDFKKVIDNKCFEWIGNQDMAKYLRPETLFGNKFEGYLNENNIKQGITNNFEDIDSEWVR